jgi:deazaflavin-dependent oxidoreductase (nitroreductase family)
MVKRQRGRLRRWLLGSPRFLFRARLGFVFRKRIICIEHEGRNTGEVYLTPVEVLFRDRSKNEYYVVSARGYRSDWFRNISQYPARSVYMGSRKRRVTQRMVPMDEAVAVMKVYERRHPKAAAALLDLAGVTPNVSTEEWVAAMEALPMVAFKPR